MVDRLGSIPLRSSVYMADTVHRQVRFPRSKKSRIRKKWRKRPENWETTVTPWDKVYMVGGVACMHPAILEKVRAELAKAMEDRIAREIFQ
jgi:hypothetical protein